MVIFVGHTLLLCSICLDIDNVSYTVADEVGRQFDGTMLCKQSTGINPPILHSTNK
jgi:hypothetical protein